MAFLTLLYFPLETTCSCKQDTKERYLGQQFWWSGKAHFGPTDRNDQTCHGRPPSKLVPNSLNILVGPNRNGPFHLMNQPKFPEFWVKWKAPLKTTGAIHSTKIPTGPSGKRGPPQKVDPFFRNFSGWTEPIHWVLDRNFRKVWLNGSHPYKYQRIQLSNNKFIHLWYLAGYVWPGLTWDVQGCHKWSLVLLSSMYFPRLA